MRRFFCVLVLFVAALTIGDSIAQSTNASVSGEITDPSGRVVSGTTVVLTNLNTGVSYQTKSNDAGLYRLPALPPGIYRANLTKDGFQSIVKGDIELHLQDEVSLNFGLKIGSVNETITVQGGAPLVNTQDASVSTVVDQTYVKNMPLNGRSFQDLILLTPGTTTQTPQLNPGNSFGIGLGLSGEFSVNGQRTESNYYTVDGVSANVGVAAQGAEQGAGLSGSVPGATALGTTQALVSVDDLQEFRVQTSSYSAEYGRNPGAQIAFDTKSGTNQWHGTAYDYFRNDYFDANDWFNNYNNLKQPPLRQNDFGGTLGGPVRIPGLYNGKDKTFFFVSYEGLRLTQPQPASPNYVPDLCMRGTTSCPSYTAANGSTVQRVPAASALLPPLNAFPKPNGPEVSSACDPTSDPACMSDGTKPSGLATFTDSWSNPSSIDSTSVRLDEVLNNKLRLFFRFAGTPSNFDVRAGQGVSPSVVISTSSTFRTYTVGASSNVTNRLSNDLRFNYTSNVAKSRIHIDSFGGGTPINLVGLLGLGGTASAVVNVFSDDFVYSALLWQEPDSAAQRQWNIVDTLNFSVGHHQLKFGADYRRLTPYLTPTNPFIGYFYFGEASVDSNSPFTEPEVFGSAYPLYQNFSAFAEDEWKALPRLNISMGLRWEVNPPPGVTHGLQPYAVTGSTPDSWALAPHGTPLWHTTWYNFAPRLGAVYMLRTSPNWETVVRGGGGVFFDTGQQLGSLGFLGPGFFAIGFTGDPFPTVPNPLPSLDPTVTPFTGAVNVVPSHLQLPYTIQWNTSVEQALGPSQALTLSYIGSHGSRMLGFQRITVPTNPNYTNWTITVNGLKSDYDALQAQFRRRLARGLTALASYTWAHCLDYGSMNFTSGFERGNCDFDLRNNFSGAFSYDLPNMGHNGFTNAVLHHWGFDDRFTVRTGFPVDLTGTQVFDPLTGKRLSNGLSFVQGQPIYIYGSQCNSVFAAPPFNATLPCPGGRAINPNAFEPVSSGFGDVPRNFARGFGAWQMDLTVRREFPIFENLKLQFRAEAFNIFNHPNFGSIGTSCGGSPGVAGCTDPQFGLASHTLATSLGSILSPLYQTGGPRSTQFALKLVF